MFCQDNCVSYQREWYSSTPECCWTLLHLIWTPGNRRLLTINDASEECIQVILDIPKLTNEVHQLLFSKNAVSQLKKKSTVEGSLDPSSLNIGVVPESLLLSILPPYITRECLFHLQYCQEIKHDYFLPSLHSPINLFSSFQLCAVQIRMLHLCPHPQTSPTPWVG